MGIKNWLKEWINPPESSLIVDVELFNESSKMIIQEILINHGIELIANAASRCKLDIYTDDEYRNKEMDYIFNIRPNENENATSFWNRVYTRLYKENEALVISINDKLFLAYNWNVNSTIIYGKRYSNIQIDDENGNMISLSRTFSSDEVFHFRLGENKATNFLKSFYIKYDRLIANSINQFMVNNASKFLVGLPTTAPNIQIHGSDNKEKDMKSYVDTLAGKLTSNEDEIIQTFNNMSVEELQKKTYSDPHFTKVIKEFGDLTANALSIPLDVFWGTKTEKSQASDDFITFSLLYPLEILETEINGKTFERDEYKKGYRVVINKNGIKYRSPLDLASNLDKLAAIGYSFNQRQSMLDLPHIDEEWANKHYVTKNYMDVENIEDDTEEKKGGD